MTRGNWKAGMVGPMLWVVLKNHGRNKGGFRKPPRLLPYNEWERMGGTLGFGCRFEMGDEYFESNRNGWLGENSSYIFLHLLRRRCGSAVGSYTTHSLRFSKFSPFSLGARCSQLPISLFFFFFNLIFSFDFVRCWSYGDFF